MKAPTSTPFSTPSIPSSRNAHTRFRGIRLLLFPLLLLICCVLCFQARLFGATEKPVLQSGTGEIGSPVLSLFTYLKFLLSEDFPVKKLTIKDLSFHSGPLSFNRLSAVAVLSESEGVRMLEIVEGKIEQVLMADRRAKNAVLFEGVTFHAGFVSEPNQEKITLSRLSIDIPNTGGLHANGVITPTTGGSYAEIESDLTGLGGILSKVFQLPDDFALLSPAKLHLAVTNQKAHVWKWHGKLAINNGEFQDASFSYAGEDLTATVNTEGSYDLTSSRGAFNIEMRIGKGEMLVDKFYHSFASAPLTFRANGSMAGFQRLALSHAELHIKDLFSMHAKGSINDLPRLTDADLYVTGDLQPIEGLFQKMIQEPFADSYPSLREAEMTGQWSTRLRVTGSLMRPNIQGDLQVRQVAASDPERGIFLRGMNMSLPLWLSFGEPSPSKSPLQAIAGSLSFAELKTPYVIVPAVALPLEATRNGWNLKDRTEILLSGGSVKILHLELGEVFSSLRSGRMAMSTDGLVLDRLLESIFDRRVPIVLRTDEWGLQLLGDKADSFGALFCDLFSGKVRLDRLSVERLFSTSPLFSMDLSWTDMDLEALTRLTQFGKITGRLKGSLKNLQLIHGAPIVFDLTLESMRRRGIPQRISVAALENVTQLGSGQSIFQGMAGVMTTFFKEFSYEKIGIHCSLKDDNFRIRGLMKDNGTEYLVKRGLFGGVNVVNQNPENRISWNDMLRRLARVSRTEEASRDE